MFGLKRVFFHSLSEIPYDARICLYGSGETGLSLKGEIERFRSDVRIVFFVDSFHAGIKDGVEVILASDIPQHTKQFDLIIISSLFWNEIERTLANIGYNGLYFIISNYMLFSLSSLKNINEFFFTRQELGSGVQDKLDHVAKLLLEPRDRQIFKTLIDFRTETEQDLYPEYFFHNLKDIKEQYLEFVDIDRVHSIIEGGVFDGSDTMKFIDQFPINEGKVYGFEPFYDSYRNSPFKPTLDARNVEVFPAALWQENIDLQFSDDNYSPSSNTITSTGYTTSKIFVKGIAGDDFVREKKIKHVDFIKLDIEGSELAALIGLKETIKRDLPQLAISIYHNKDHLYQIPLFLRELVPAYRFHIGIYSPSFVDSVLYASVPL